MLRRPRSARRARLALLASLALLLAPAAARGEGFASVERARAALRGSADAAQRTQAAAWLAEPAQRASPAAAAALAEALDDAAPSVRRASAAGLSEPGGAERRERLTAALARERAAEVLPALLLALGAQRDPAALPALLAHRRHPLPGVRAAVLTAVGETGGEAARRALLEALADPGGPDSAFAVRAAAVLGLARAGRRGDIGPVLACYREGGGWSWWLARSALAKAVPVIDPDPLPLLEHLVYDGDRRVAVTAAAALAAAGAPERLVALLDHAAPAIRAAAAAACAQAGRREALGALERRAARDPDLSVRWSAALALFALGAPAGDEAVLAGLSSSEPAIWAEALAALAARTGEQHGRDAPAWRAALLRGRRR